MVVFDALEARLEARNGHIGVALGLKKSLFLAVKFVHGGPLFGRFSKGAQIGDVVWDVRRGLYRGGPSLEGGGNHQGDPREGPWTLIYIYALTIT